MRLETGPERLDEDLGTASEIRDSLEDLWWINRRFGGLSTWPRLLDAALDGDAGGPASPRTIRLLDVGAGTGELTAALAAHLRARGHAVTAIALDRRGSHLLMGAGPCPAPPCIPLSSACRPGLAAIGDATRLPFADRGVELVVANLFLHHFHDEPGDPAASVLLAELFRVAGHALILNDLERAWPPYLFTRALLPWMRRSGGRRLSPVTLHDAPRSIRQAYTLPELRALARRAGLEDIRLLRLWPYRMGLIAFRGAGA